MRPPSERCATFRYSVWNSLKDTRAEDGGQVEGGHAVPPVVELHLREEAAQVAEESAVRVRKLPQQLSQVGARDVIAALFGLTTAGGGRSKVRSMANMAVRSN